MRIIHWPLCVCAAGVLLCAGCAQQGRESMTAAMPLAGEGPAKGSSVLFTDRDPLYVAAQSLVHWWPGNGHGLDLAGSRHAQLAPGVTFSAGRGGREAFTFDGEKGWVDCGKGEPSLPKDAFTLMFWYRGDKQNEQNGFQYLAMCWDNGGLCVAINHSRPGSFCIGLGTGSGDDAEKGTLSQNIYTQDEPDEGWHHVAMTFDGLRVCIYRDGRLRANEDWGVYTPGNARLTLGRSVDLGTSSKPFKGQMQDVAIFSRALPEGQMRAVYEAQLGKGSPVETSALEDARFARGLKGRRAPLAWYAALRFGGNPERLLRSRPDPMNPASVHASIVGLDSENWTEREAAAGKLEEMGEEGRAALLESLMRGMSLEFEARAVSLLGNTNGDRAELQHVREARVREVRQRGVQ